MYKSEQLEWPLIPSAFEICVSEGRVLRSVFILAMVENLWIIGQGCYRWWQFLLLLFVLLSVFCFLDLNGIFGISLKCEFWTILLSGLRIREEGSLFSKLGLELLV